MRVRWCGCVWQVVVGHVLVQRFEIIEHQNVGARGRALLEDALHVLEILWVELPVHFHLLRVSCAVCVVCVVCVECVVCSVRIRKRLQGGSEQCSAYLCVKQTHLYKERLGERISVDLDRHPLRLDRGFTGARTHNVGVQSAIQLVSHIHTVVGEVRLITDGHVAVLLLSSLHIFLGHSGHCHLLRLLLPRLRASCVVP